LTPRCILCSCWRHSRRGQQRPQEARQNAELQALPGGVLAVEVQVQRAAADNLHAGGAPVLHAADAEVLAAVDLAQRVERLRPRHRLDQDHVEQAVGHAGLRRDRHAAPEGGAVGDGDHVGAAVVPGLAVQADAQRHRPVAGDGGDGRQQKRPGAAQARAVDAAVHLAAEAGAGDVEEVARAAVAQQQADIQRLRLRAGQHVHGGGQVEGDAGAARPVAPGSDRQRAEGRQRRGGVTLVQGDQRVHHRVVRAVAANGDDALQAALLRALQRRVHVLRLLRDGQLQVAEGVAQDWLQPRPQTACAPAVSVRVEDHQRGRHGVSAASG